MERRPHRIVHLRKRSSVYALATFSEATYRVIPLNWACWRGVGGPRSPWAPPRVSREFGHFLFVGGLEEQLESRTEPGHLVGGHDSLYQRSELGWHWH